MKDTVSIGKIVATHGLKGELILLHALGSKSDLKDLKALFIEEQKGSLIPYFVESANGKTHTETRLKLEGVNTREEALKLLQKQVWMEESDFNRLVSTRATIALLGFAIVEHKQVLGTISEVIEQPHQVICTIWIDGKEVLIPINESTLRKIDRKAKQVHVLLPEGLLDIYLQ